MQKRPLFVVCLLLGAAAWASAQAKPVTNSDLEKYRLERLKAERDYRENYAKMGFSSPEELERRREQSRIESQELSASLRSARLEGERLEAEQRKSEQLAAAYYRAAQVERELRYSGPNYFWSYGRRHRPSSRPPFFQSGHFAGGQFWPTGPRTRPQPMWVQLPR